MRKFLLLIISTILISACSSPPKPKEPSGDWIQINNSSHYEENTDYRKG